ncbi:unnamed protein product [Ilex paraguariensis]|uniref:Protein kinase domain-containing protein n=1 Tax=Ilex paraguariensis TaxID=185542 RepID=A0ABC8SNU3_9AQUA
MVHPGDAEWYPSSTSHPVGSFHDINGKSTILTSVSNYDYSFHPSTSAPVVENVVPKPLHGHMTRQGDLDEEQRHSGLHVQDPGVSVMEVKLKRDSSIHKKNDFSKDQSIEKEVLVKEGKMKRDLSIPKMNESEKFKSLENEYIVSVASSAVDMEAPFLPTKLSVKNQEPVKHSMPPESLKEEKLNKINEDDHIYASGDASAAGYGDSDAYPEDSGNPEPPMLPQRFFRSERIPREQAGLNRLSKSDDSSGSQFLISHAHSDGSQQITEAVDKLRDLNVAAQTDRFISSAKPVSTNLQTVEDGLGQFQKSKEIAGKINANTNIDDGGLEAKFPKSEPKPALRTVVDDHDMVQVGSTYKDKETSRSNLPATSRVLSGKHEDSASRPKEIHWDEKSTAVSQGKPSVGVGSPEHGDILIDINDRFPHDFLSDIFSKARILDGSAGISPLHSDGTGLSLNMENHEPNHWSFFQKLAQDSMRKDVSLMDQDHLGFSPPITNIKEGAPVDYSFPPYKADGVALDHMDSRVSFDSSTQQPSLGVVEPNTMDLHSDYNPSQTYDNQSAQFDGLVNPRRPESGYEDGKLEAEIGQPLVDLSLRDFDPSSLQIIKNEDLEELRELGSGTFGTVYHGKWRGTDVAIKRIKKSCFTGRSSEQERLTVEFWHEADILSKLHHPNVVAFYGVVQDGPGGTLATVTEYMVNGSLRHVLLSKDRHLDRRKRLIIAMDAAFGMEYLHSKNIVHFDLKCDNLLVNLKDPLQPICKVGDFGLSKIKRNTLVTGGVRGTLPWMAPELLNGSSSKVSEKVDVFSFGIVLWEILTGEEPYANMHYGAIIGGIVNNTLRPPVPNFCDPDWKLLMEQCWAPDPVVRPSFAEIAGRLRVLSTAGPPRPHGYPAQNQGSK